MPMGDYFMEYQSYGVDFRDAITFKYFYQLKGNNRSKGRVEEVTRMAPICNA